MKWISGRFKKAYRWRLRMRFVAMLPLTFLLGLGIALADDDRSTIDARVLDNRLNNLESQSVQRRGRQSELIDLLNRQDDRIAGQQLNTLKTKRPRDAGIPVLERKLLRSRRPGGRFTPR